MAKQLNVSLAFSADTSQAQKSIQNLQTSLAKISSMKIGDNLQLKEASDAAKMLSYHLNQAYNTTTGNIDLSALNHSLQKSSTNVTELSNKLLQAGSNGQQAFVNLAQAISSAEYPMFKLGKRLTEFGNTLKNTIRWQFSSSLLHGMMGAYQQAIGYAEDLNASLTNIRVVTGNSTEEMARFAEHANKAAKSLSTTTTAYTDAALIFYQQGLGDKDVQERTDITVKMANVTGESVTTVSDQLTAIWNNFNKEGDVAYEHYADVLTALGAKTASSTDEIAGGLEKFAAIADTIGLSYEYAAAALATITSNTRQSEEVVGTALKTIFARLQGLKLGETLEDGVDLNKYSEALQKVGVEALDATGELRRADDILTDMAAKWETLSNAEQVALAQAVGGVRQYNQIVALMDEWDSGDADSMLANLETAYNADGALQEQADIWAESWEAAQKRVKAAAEGIYDSILDDKLFIGFNNVFADMLTGLEQVIDGVGGLKGVFIGVGSFILSLMAHKIQPALTSFVLNIKSMFSSAQAQAAALTGELQGKVSTELSKTGDNAYDASQKQALSNANNLAEARTRLTIVSKNLTEQEKLLYQFDISLIEQDAQKAQSIADEITAIERERDALYQSVDATQEKIAINQAYDQELKSLIETQSIWKSIMDESYDGGTEEDQVESSDQYFEARQAVDEYIASKQTLNSIIEQTIQAIMDEYTGQEYVIDGFEQGAGVLQAFTNNLDALGKELGDVNRQFSANEVDKYKRQLDLFGKTLDNLQGISADTKKELAQLFAKAKASKGTESMRSNISEIISKIKELKFTSQELKEMGTSLSPSQFKKFLANLDEGARKEKELIAIQDELNNKMNNFNPAHMISGLERLTSVASAMGSVAMMGQSISSMINSWSNVDLSFGEKLSTTFMSLSMLIPGAVSAVKGLNTALQGTALQQALVSAAMKLTTRDSTIAAAKTILLTTAKNADMTADQKRVVTIGAAAAAMKAEGLALDKNKRAYIARLVAQKAANGATKEEIAAFLASKLGIDADTAAKIANKIATDSLKTSIMGLLGPIGAVIAIITALVAAFSAWDKAQKEKAARDLENRKKASEAAIEEANKLEEERKKIEQLYTEYINLQNSLDGSVEAKEALRSKTEELCTALGVEWNALDKLQGKYDDVNRQILETRRTALLENIGKLQNDIAVAGEYVEDTVDQVQAEGFSEYDFGTSTGTRFGETKQDEWWNPAEWWDGNDTYQTLENYKHNYLYGGGSSNVGIDNTNIRNLFYDWMYENYSDILEESSVSEDDVGWGNRGQRALYFNEGVEEAEIISAVKEFSDYLMTNHEKLGVNTDAGAYDWFKQFNGDAGVEEQITAIDGMNEELLASVKELAQVEAELAGMEIAEINSEEDFEAYKTQWMTNFRQTMSDMGIDISSITDDALNDIAEEFLGKYKNIGDIITERDVSESISEETGISVDKVKEIAAEYEDFLDLVPEINFDLIDSEEKLRTVLNMLQAEADANKIEAKVETVAAAKGNLKEDMSYGDYMDFETSSGIKWGQFDEDLKASIIDYTSFLQMSYEEQVSYLDSIQSAYHTAQAQALSTNLSNSQQLLNNYLTEYEALQEKINTAKQEAAAPVLEQIEDFKNKQSQEIPGSEAYNAYAEGIARVTAQYEAIMNNDASVFISEEELARMYELQGLLGVTQDGINSLDAQLSMVVRDILNSATSVADLESSVTSLIQNGIAVDYSIFGEALIKLASEYDNCTTEIQEFQAAMNGTDAELMAAKQHQLEAAMAIGEAAKEYGIAADTLEDVADAFETLADSGEEQYKILKEDGEALSDATVRYARLQEAVLNLAENYDDYSKVLEDIQAASDDIDKAMVANSKSGKDLQKSLAGLLGTSEDLIDANLLSAIDPKDFAEAAEGNEAAIERIRDAFIELQATANNIDVTGLKEELASLEEGIVVDITLETMPFLYALIEAQLAAGATAADIQNLLSGFNIDATVTDFEGTLNEAVAASASASKQIIANNSYSQDVKTTTVDTPVVTEEVAYSTAYSATQVPSTSYILKNGADEPVPVTEYRTSWTKTVSPEVTTTETTDQEVAKEVTTSNAAGDTAQVKGVSIENAHKSSGGKVGGSTKQAAQTAKKNSGGGGGGSKPKTKPTSEARKKKSDVVDRYKEVEDKLDDVRDAMEDASKSADRLWGASRAKQLQKVNKEIQNEIALLKQQKQEAISYLSIDKTDLISKGGALGAIFEFDSSGNIANYEEAMSRVYAAREAMLDSFGAEMDEAEEERLKDFDERLEKLKEAIDQYDETRELIEDLDNTIDDQFNAWQDNNYEILNHTLEVNIEINDRELEILDYYLSKIEDDFYNMAEAGALMLGNLSGKNIGEGGQLGGYIEGLQEYEDHLERLKQSYEKGEISQAAYIEGLQEVQDGLLENLESIQELDKTMMEYYGDTIAAAGEELAKFTDQMEHQSSVLEHYKTILELTGKETDYEAIGIVLEGQAKAAENRVKVNKETADMYREQADARYAEYQKALAQGNEQAAELYKKQYEAALQAANEAEEEYLSSVEEWAESVRAVLENTMADLSRTLENALTGGTSFDQMSIALERAASLQEEYLTSTNQIYETNKLMRSAQQEIDKMTNSVAKRRLQAFISETKELQNQKELSQYELEIQQAKYDLLLAQIALEEAQQSKSTVRLQRDNEGNFGYVYTADSSQIADAQQKLEDAQNSLYNIGLEGANGYAEKYQQTLSEMYDTLTDLQNQYLEGAFESEEEYHKAVDAAKHYYYDKLTQYSSLYTVALTTDSRVVADAWSSDFQDMIYSTDEWRSAVDTYINDIQGAFQTYGYEMERIANETIGTSLDNIKDKTEEVVDASDKLVSTITDDGGVIDALTSEMNAVANLTGEYANLRSTLQGLLSDYEKLLKGINDTTEAEKDKPDTSGDKPKEPSNPSSPSKPNTPAPSTPQDDGERNYDSTTKQGVALAIWNGNYGWGNGTTRKQRLEEKGFNYREIQGIVDRTNPNGNWRSRYGISDLSKYAYSSFDTGGYTGNWEGQYGKLALLHQKELVLNAGDTENFLASMEILERILKVIDLQSASAQIGGLLSSPGFIGSGSQVVEQSVTIEASFPGVQDRNEIEEAFNNLINRASQYANRK